MVTRLTDYTKQFWSLLSTDDTDPLVPHNGDEAILIDRNERYVFDEENQIWRHIPMSGGGGGTLTTKTITENGTYAAADDNADGYSSVTVNVAASGGAQLIASGTYTGAGTVNVDFPVGKKMPKKDFLFHLYAPDGTVFAQDTDYKIAQFHADSWGTQYDLSANSDNCTQTPLVNYTVGDTSPQGKANWYIAYVRNTAVAYQIQANSGWNRVKRDSNGFYILMRNYNTAWYFPSGMTYSWELLYYGSDPTNDIVEVP